MGVWRGVIMLATAAAVLPAPAGAALPDELTRVSVNAAGALADSDSTSAAISGNGRFVAFTSRAANFVPGDTNDAYDVFVKDLEDGSVERVSLTHLDAQSSGPVPYPVPVAISADGTRVAFASDADDLVPGDTNEKSDVFVRDTVAGTTVRASVPPLGGEFSQGAGRVALSANGRFAVFAGFVPTGLFVRDLLLETTELASIGTDGMPVAANSGTLSADGRYLAFVGDEVVVRDLVADTSARVDVDSTEVPANDEPAVTRPSISADGQRIAFASPATNLVPGSINNVFLRDLAAGTTVDVPGVPAASPELALSADGARLAIGSQSRLRVVDVATGVGGLVDVSPSCGVWTDNVFAPTISDDGGLVAFPTDKTLLPATGRTQVWRDVYVAVPDVLAPVVSEAPRLWGFQPVPKHEPYNMLPGGALPVDIRWAGTDDRRVDFFQLDRPRSSGGWEQAFTGPASSLRAILAPGAREYRVTATDCGQSRSETVGGPAGSLVVRQEGSTAVRYGTGWKRTSAPSAAGGRIAYSIRKGAAVTFRFEGRAVAWIGRGGPDRGAARIYIDGKLVKRLVVRGGPQPARQVLFVRNFGASGAHTLRLVADTSLRRVRIDVDAFAVLR